MSARRLQHGFTAHRARGFILLPVVLALMLVAAVAFLLDRAGGMNMWLAAGGLQADSARYVAEAGLAQINAQTQGLNCTGYTDLPATTFGAGSFTATVNPKVGVGSPVILAATGTTADGAAAALTRSNVTVHQTTQQVVTLQPGVEGLDTYIRSSGPSTNYGADNVLKIATGNTVALVQFDLFSSIPANSSILSAQFSLYHSTGSTDTVSSFRVTTPWTEGTGAAGSGATWTNYDTTNAGGHTWATAGGDYDPASGVAITLPGNSQWANWDLTAQIAAWNAGTQPNYYGIAVVGKDAGASDAFVSSDDTSNPSQHPTLTVTFLPPCGWVPSASSVTLPASQDTWIENSGSGAANYGGSSSFTVEAGSTNGHGLVQFDLSSIPTSTMFKSAKLRLWAGSFSPVVISTITLNPVQEPWVEGTRNGSGSADGATWKKRDGSISWRSFGGWFAAPTAPPATLGPPFAAHWVEWDVKDLAQQWLTSPSTNYGVGVLINTSSTVIFNSRQATALQPQLVLTY